MQKDSKGVMSEKILICDENEIEMNKQTSE